MSALLFPGQGSQIVGMGLEFFQKFKIVKNIFKQADENLGFSLSKIILEGPEDQLQLTKHAQPAILTVSYSIFKVLKEEFNFNFKEFKYFAGHSLGEYSALVCSNSLKFNDALFLLFERGKAMQEAVPVGKGGMLAILGAPIEKIEEIIKKNKSEGICEIANDNADGQVIISGDKESVDNFNLLIKEERIKSIPLKVSAPFHCSLMKKAAIKMEEKINNTIFENPAVEIISNVTAQVEKNPENIKKLLIRQIYSTVQWRQSLIKIYNEGSTNFVEIGPGKALTGMVKRTIKNVNCFSINSIIDIKNLQNEFKK